MGKEMIRAAIIGGSGYTGIELLRILAGHGRVAVTAVTSEKSAGKKVGEVFPHLSGYGSLTYEPFNKEALLDRADVFFLALPHAASQEAVHFFYSRRRKVIDLSADYRLRDPKVYQEWYATPHNYTSTLKKAVYGLPERYRKSIRRASLIANPGCYPTSAILGLVPAIMQGIIDAGSIVVDSKSGTSGAGRKADIAVSFCEVNEGFKAYGIGVHRHTPEIEQEISAVAGSDLTINFTPHLVPADRGILTTIYARLLRKIKTEEISSMYKKAYGKEPFVRLLNPGAFPNIKNVRGSNICEIGLKVNERTGTLIIVTAIDNLVKGASGQAVQNMNIMFGIEETEGLKTPALFP